MATNVAVSLSAILLKTEQLKATPKSQHHSG